MKILALQLKRIGDLVLTVPALTALAEARADARVTLAVHASAAPLLPAIPHIEGGIVFGPGRGWTPWQQVLTGRWDAVLDFTSTDRSALASRLSRAPRRVTFEWVRKRFLRGLAYTEFVDSPVRDFHTADHYTHLLRSLGVERTEACEARLRLPEAARSAAAQRLREAGIGGAFAIVHPGSARPEKYWAAARWAEVIRHLRTSGLDCILTGGSDPVEAGHLAEIAARSRDPESGGKLAVFSGSLDLLELAALVEAARLVLSCDTAIVHFAAALQRPQISLFGPTNPFHWRPRHPSAIVLSAAQPEAPLTAFDPRMKGAPMDRLSTEVVIRATDHLLQAPPPATFPCVGLGAKILMPSSQPAKKVSRKDIARMSFGDFLRASREPYRRLFSYLKPYRGRFVMGILFGALFGAVQALLVFDIQYVAAAVFEEPPPAVSAPADSGQQAAAAPAVPAKPKKVPALVRLFPRLGQLHFSGGMGVTLLICTTIPLLMCLRGVCSYLNSYYMLWVSVRVLDDIRQQVFRHTLGQSMEFFNKSKAGELVQTVFNQTRMAQQALTTIASDLVKQPITIVTGLGHAFLDRLALHPHLFCHLPALPHPGPRGEPQSAQGGRPRGGRGGHAHGGDARGFRGHSRGQDACARRF